MFVLQIRTDPALPTFNYDFQILMKKSLKILLLLTLAFVCNSTFAQNVASEVKNAIIKKYNLNDFKGIYLMTDTAFSNHISEQQLTAFLRNNRNSGNILSDTLLKADKGKYTYLLIAEARNINMTIEVTAAKKISGFGFTNVAIVLLEKPQSVKSTNPLKTTLDLAVDSAAREYYRNPNAHSVAIGLIQNCKRYTYYYGDITKGSLFEIGSITKTFTATLLAQALIDKKVGLTDDIRNYLPDVYPNLAYNDHPITLQDLANHTARLPEMPDDIGYQPDFDPLRPEKGYDSVMFYATLHRVKLDTVPGSKFKYSNYGLAVLGHILERVYHSSYSDLMKKYITQPFGMKQTYYELTDNQKDKMAIPHGDNGRPVPFQQEDMFGPAGEIHSTLNDMLNYLDQQIKETSPTVKLSHQPTANNLGLAWGVRNTGSYRDVQHNGSTVGSTSHISAFPELNSGCVILTNSKANFGKLVYAIQQIARRKPN